MRYSILILFGLCAISLAKQQRYIVKGKLVCPSNPEAAAKARVKIYDEDTGPDSVIDEKDGINADGTFRLDGRASDAFPGDDIDVKMKIYHDCMDNVPGRQRELKFGLPDEYIDSGEFDFGVFNLEIRIEDEESTETDIFG